MALSAAEQFGNQGVQSVTPGFRDSFNMWWDKNVRHPITGNRKHDSWEDYWQNTGRSVSAPDPPPSSNSGEQVFKPEPAPRWDEFWSRYNEEARRATEEEREYASREAQIARDWSERMSNTEVQRRMADLSKAGVNPLLAVMGSSMSASTPSASQAHRTHARDVHGGNTNLTLAGHLIHMIAMLGSSAINAAGGLLRGLMP